MPIEIEGKILIREVGTDRIVHTIPVKSRKRLEKCSGTFVG